MVALLFMTLLLPFRLVGGMGCGCGFLSSCTYRMEFLRLGYAESDRDLCSILERRVHMRDGFSAWCIVEQRLALAGLRDSEHVLNSGSWSLDG